MTLTKEQQIAREGRLTASRIAVLMNGEKAEILDLWKELVGDPTWLPPNFFMNWPVNFGEATEAINLTWFTRKHGEISRQGEVVIHSNQIFACTLDAWSIQYKCPIECKTVGGFEKLTKVIERYQPQMQFQMALTKAEQCAFSAIEGGREPTVELIKRDSAYIKEMFVRGEQFMKCVQNLIPPVELEPVSPPVKATKEYDYTANNLWCALANDFISTKSQHRVHEDSKESIKKIVPPDAVRVIGGGIEATRDRANRLKISELR